MAARWLPVLVAATLTLGGSVGDRPPQDALKLILKQDTATGKAKAVWVSKHLPPCYWGSRRRAGGRSW
jgi:hypothetical protein